MKKENTLSNKRARSPSGDSLNDSEESGKVKTKKTKFKPKLAESDDDNDDITVTDNEVSIGLDSKKRVTVRKFKGQVYVDIREFYEKDGERKPGSKGICLKPELWEKLKKRMKDVDDAIKNMK
jgi:hypothetical protein